MEKSLLTDLKNDKNGLRTIFHIIIVLLIFIFSQLLGGGIVDVIYLSTKLNLRIFFLIMRGAFEIGLFYFFMYLYVNKVLKLNMSYFRIIKPKFSLLFIIIAIMLPVFVVLYYFIFISGTLSYGNSKSKVLYIIYAFKRGLTAGITEEFLFRGFIMKLIESRWNKKIAIIVPSIIFASLHLFKGMGFIDILLLFIAGITVSIMFSLVTYQKDNIWNSVIIHTLWNVIVIGIFHISPQNDFENLINYVIDSNNVLITGGRFGIESGLPAIIGYTIVIIVLILRRNKQHISSDI